MERMMNIKVKKALLLFIFGVVFYIVFNYLPIKFWIEKGIEDAVISEYIWITVKLVFYSGLCIPLLLLKKKAGIDIEKPFKEAPFYFLIPLLIPNVGNFLAVYFIDPAVRSSLHYGILVYDLITDFFTSVYEDVVFVDLGIFLLTELLKENGFRRLLAVLIAGLFFTAVHSYSYLYEDLALALFQQFYVFLLTLECGYLAIYYDSALIPIVAHYLFNALNHVAFGFFFVHDGSLIGPDYLIFTGVIALFAVGYTILLWNYSNLINKEALEQRKGK